MTNSNKQIVQLAKQGLTGPEIAEALTMDVEAVEFVLKNDGEAVKELKDFAVKVADHRENMKKGLSALAETAVDTIKEMMQCAEKDSVRLAAAEYVVDFNLGLKEPTKLNLTFNIVDFNERLQQAKARRAELEAATVDVESAVVNSGKAA